MRGAEDIVGGVDSPSNGPHSLPETTSLPGPDFPTRDASAPQVIARQGISSCIPVGTRAQLAPIRSQLVRPPVTHHAGGRPVPGEPVPFGHRCGISRASHRAGRVRGEGETRLPGLSAGPDGSRAVVQDQGRLANGQESNFEVPFWVIRSITPKCFRIPGEAGRRGSRAISVVGRDVRGGKI